MLLGQIGGLARLGDDGLATLKGDNIARTKASARMHQTLSSENRHMSHSQAEQVPSQPTSRMTIA